MVLENFFATWGMKFSGTFVVAQIAEPESGFWHLDMLRVSTESQVIYDYSDSRLISNGLQDKLYCGSQKNSENGLPRRCRVKSEIQLDMDNEAVCMPMPLRSSRSLESAYNKSSAPTQVALSP
jgi:hypothetical protein